MKLAIFFLLCCIIYGLAFQYPSHANSLQRQLAKHHYHKIPLKKLSTGHDIVSATINHISGFFVLDTGAISLVNKSVESKYELTADDYLNTYQAAGAGGKITISMFSHKGMTLGHTQVSSHQIGSSDLSTVLQGLFSTTGQVLDGIIGQDVLVASNAIIDTKNQHLFVQSTSAINKFQLEQTMEGLGFKIFDLQPLVLEQFAVTFLTLMVNINGVEALFLIDSGASVSMLNNTNLSQFKLSDGLRLSKDNRSGAGGAFSITSYELDSFALDQIVINKPIIATANLSAVVEFIEKHAYKRIDGVLGQDVLSDLAAVINVAESQLYLKLK
jgi:predicted aspartyl protease